MWLPAGGQVQVERRHVVQHSVKGLLRVLPCLADLEVILRGKFPAKNGVTSETSGCSYGLATIQHYSVMHLHADRSRKNSSIQTK